MANDSSWCLVCPEISWLVSRPVKIDGRRVNRVKRRDYHGCALSVRLSRKSVVCYRIGERDSHNEIAGAVNLTWRLKDLMSRHPSSINQLCRVNKIKNWSFVIKLYIVIRFSNCIQISSLLQVIGEFFLIYVMSLKSICRRYREFVARLVANFQFPILILLYRDLFIFSIHVWRVSDYFAVAYRRPRIAPHMWREETAFSSFSFAEQCHFDLSHRGYVFQNLLPISVRKIPYKDSGSTRKFRAVISHWLNTIIKVLNIHFRCE